MEFRLKYEGPLKARGGPKEKHRLRQQFHPQLKELIRQPPLNKLREYLNTHYTESVCKQLGGFTFVYLVCTALKLVAELDIVLMRPDEPGKIISSGDIDNRLKTLFDALRPPQDPAEIPAGMKPAKDEEPFYCLLEDDNLITSVKVTCDRLLQYKKRSDVFLLIHVTTKQIAKTKMIDLMVP